MLKIEKINEEEFGFVDATTKEVKEKINLEKIANNIYLLKGNYGHYFGFYDKETNLLTEVVGTSYELAGNLILFKNLMLRPTSDTEVENVEHYSIYDIKNKKFIGDKRYHDYMGEDYVYGVSKYISATIAGNYVCLFYRDLEDLKVDYYNMETGELFEENKNKRLTKQA